MSLHEKGICQPGIQMEDNGSKAEAHIHKHLEAWKTITEAGLRG